MLQTTNYAQWRLGTLILFLASTSQVTSGCRGEQGFVHLVLSLNISAGGASSPVVGFVSSSSACLTWASCSEETQAFLKDESSASLSMSILGTCLKWGEIKSFPPKKKFFCKGRGFFGCSGEVAWASFPRMTPWAESSLTSVHKSWADPGSGMCLLAQTHSCWPAFGGFSAPLFPSQRPKWAALIRGWPPRGCRIKVL